MGRRVLVPYDSSEESQYALDHALAVFDTAEVVLIHAVKPSNEGANAGGTPSYRQRLETAERMLDSVCQWYDESERERIETTVRYGRPIREILDYTAEKRIDHIVIGSRGLDGTARLLLGRVAETVVRRSPVPVTVVRDPAEFETGHVLVPFDASTHAQGALRYALDQFPDARLTALYVSSPPTGGVESTETLFGVLSDWDDDREEHVESVLGVAAELGADHDRDLTTTSVDGDPADTIIEWATTTDVDHVVLGSAGRDGVAHLLLGSVAETVVRRSPVTVTIAK